jgi:hypothetical protein
MLVWIAASRSAADIPRAVIGGRSMSGRVAGRKWNFRFCVTRSYSTIPLPGNFTCFSSARSPQMFKLVYSSEPA